MDIASEVILVTTRTTVNAYVDGGFIVLYS